MMESERAKMLRGAAYLASDPELVAGRERARRLWLKFNQSDPASIAERKELLGQLLGSFAPGAWVEPPFYCDYGTQIRLGPGVYVNMNAMFLDPAPIHIERQAFLGPCVQLLTATHPLDPEARVSGPESALPIRIGARAWLGGGVIVLPGVTIGSDSTIGAGSVVVSDVPAGVLAVGNPCRVVRSL